MLCLPPGIYQPPQNERALQQGAFKKMIDPMVLMTAGVLLDICGTFVIFKKTLKSNRITPDVGGPMPENATEVERKKLMDKYFKEKLLEFLYLYYFENLKSNHWMKFGSVLLIVGTNLVLIANWITHLP